MIKQGIYFEVQDIDFSEVFELVVDSITEYFDSRHYLTYLFSNVFSEKPQTYEQYKADNFKQAGKGFAGPTRVSKLSNEEIKKANEKVLLNFLQEVK